MYLVTTKVMVSKIGQVTVRPCGKKDPCGIRGRKAMLNAALCKSCEKSINGRCAKIKIVTNRPAIDFECRKCRRYHKDVEDQKENVHDDGETVTDFSYLEGRIYIGGGCEAAATSRTRI